MNTLLVRHTRVLAEGLCYGRFDVPLAPSCDEEADRTRSALPWAPELIWSSPAARCRWLAERLAPKGIEPRVDARLAELAMGEWEGRRWDDLRGPAVDAWMADPWHARPPGGESADDLLTRVAAFRAELLACPPSRPTLIVTHAGVIRAWRSVAEKRPLSDLFGEPVVFGGFVEAR